MYSGTTIHKGSGKLICTHQKIDRLVRRKLQPYIPSSLHFPTSRQIINFEGLNGPDGIKKKSPKQDEPWHWIDPTNPDDRQILDLIAGHEKNLIKALTNDNRERAAFEASWLAHALVDGLTPAHHYPYLEKLGQLIGDDNVDKQEVMPKKLFTSADTWRGKLKNNYEYYKPNGNGLMSAHFYFELGVTVATAALRFHDVRLTAADRAAVEVGGIVPLYMDIVWRVYNLKIYDKFLAAGWTPKLTRQIKNDLMPIIIHTVLLSWYYCVVRAEAEQKRGAP
jgi:hypothetical protein